jgi:hypothetical protein
MWKSLKSWPVLVALLVAVGALAVPIDLTNGATAWSYREIPRRLDCAGHAVPGQSAGHGRGSPEQLLFDLMAGSS